MLAAFVFALPLATDAACQIETLDLPVKMMGSRAVATVGINGTPVPLTVDSGAFYSMLTEAAAMRLNLPKRHLTGVRIEGITGQVDAYLTTVEKLQLLKGDIPRVDFVVGGNEPGAGTMGLLGRNLLSFTDTEYDLANGVIHFSFPNRDCAKANLAYWAGATHVTEVDLEPERSDSKTPALRARVKLNGTEFVGILDTGATTIVTGRAARRAGVTEAQMTPSGTVYGAGRGSAKGWVAPFDRFEIGDEAITQNRLPVGEFKLDDAGLLLGIDFFLAHRIYVSKAQSKMFITYNGGTVFALNRSRAPGAVPSSAEPAASSAHAADADQFARRAAALTARRDYERALVELSKSLELEPTSAAHFAQQGEVHEALRRPADALASYDRALELDPTFADARYRRVMLRIGAKDRDGAKSDLDALDKSLASQADLRLAMAGRYMELEQPAQSLVQLNQWLNGRCFARAMLGIELDQALEDCNEAVAASNSSNAPYLDSRGWVQLRLGKYQRALADFDRALELRPGVAFTLYGRGLAKLRLGDAAQSEADLASARKAQPDIDLNVTRAGLMLAQEPKP
jgi:tetratricopeptide (TPR) repeat protein/predicted aspartyl protease